VHVRRRRRGVGHVGDERRGDNRNPKSPADPEQSAYQPHDQRHPEQRQRPGEPRRHQHPAKDDIIRDGGEPPEGNFPLCVRYTIGLACRKQIPLIQRIVREHEVCEAIPVDQEAQDERGNQCGQ
jgi:hypothetical protein